MSQGSWNVALVVALGSVLGCAVEHPLPPASLEEALEQRLRSVAEVGPVRTLGHEIAEVDVTLRAAIDAIDAIDADGCDAVRERAQGACADATAAGLGAICRATVVWFEAQGAFRCSARLHLTPTTRRMATVVSFDLVTAAPLAPAECGNGRVDGGEECDDGNHDLWDGCGPTCLIDEFQGCEAVIEHAFESTGLARVARDGWLSPRSHLMIHPTAQALAPVNARVCHQALATATDVCSELVTTMPFVATCAPEVEHLAPPDGSGESCAVRLTVGFRETSPADGVFTTRQPGLLSFTIH